MVNVTLARPDGRVTGSNVLFGPDGTRLAVSDKQVLMGSERDHLDPALERTPAVDTAIGRVGLYSCMDGVINETPRMLALDGAPLTLCGASERIVRLLEVSGLLDLVVLA